MTLTFRYVQDPITSPVPSLPGRATRPRTVVTVGLAGPAGAWPVRALLDTGADDTIFPEAVAQRVGIDLSAALPYTLTPIGGATAVIRYCIVPLRLSDGNEFREWPAWVGFTATRMRYPVPGYAGCLQFFTATFHGDREEVELTVNGLYPGT